MSKTRGNLTLPSESGFLKETLEIMDRWGADALRDSDGTKLNDEIKGIDAKIYTTYFVSRGHNDFSREHMDETQSMYLMSKFTLAKDETLSVSIMDGYFKKQVTPDYDHDPKIWWEVMDRTLDKPISETSWKVDKKHDAVIIIDAVPYHEYTVSFLVHAIWDPTQMYNHITNNWGDKEHDIPFDVRKENSNRYIHEYIENWLKENDRTDVVRFTTFFYHFTLVFNELGKEKYVDWFGYSASVSVEALLAFEKAKGYRLRPEHIVDKGYYNSAFRVPSKEYLDFVDFQSEYVAIEAKKLVDKVHAHGKEAMMFLGDNWIGTEPYGKYFESIGLDAVVGSVGGGATLRMISEIPGVKYTEGRFLPYFFPDTFREGNDPTIEAKENWLSARRAIMRKPVDRIGYGGYLSLAYKFPNFVDYIESVSDEFREIYGKIKNVKPYSGLKVGILNSWGKTRSWQTHMVAHALWYKQIYSYLGVLESLSGSSVQVEFISFKEVRENGIPLGMDVIINAGDAGTAFSGGEEWLDETLITKVRRWIYEGGGFIGIGEPSAIHHGGKFFQLSDALGIDKELGFSLSTDKYFKEACPSHFITAEMKEKIDFGESMKNIYATGKDTEIIEYSHGEIHLSAHDYGKGRAVYIAGLPFNTSNTRLLLRAMYYSAHQEKELKKFYADNINVEVNAYPEIKKYAVLNNSDKRQNSKVYDGKYKEMTLELLPGEIRWLEMED